MINSYSSTNRRSSSAFGHNRSRRTSRYSSGSWGGGGRARRRNPYRGDFISHEMYVSRATDTTTSQENMYERQMTFSDFKLNPKLLKNISAHNYIHPTKIQAQVIAPILEGRDIIGQAATGSGKTAAFLIPIINALLNDPAKKCLVVAPTRELVKQIQTEFRLFAQNTFINDVLIVGGASYSTQIRLLKRNHQFIIATPGRLIDLYKRQNVILEDFDIIVLDEVDQMLDMGFIHDVKLIISKLKSTRQSLFFSATMASKIKEIANSLLRNPVTFELTQQVAVKNVDQNVVKVDSSKGKIETLHELLIKTEFQRVLVFSRTKRGADEVALALRKKGHKADALHGNKSLGQRTKILSMFKRDEIDILVATDVASRGIDVPDISHVINYDEPATYMDYIHRIGRTGRIGKKGCALTFI
ncbi:MAG TPA: DEAD/DEAH box helicase [Patescibacteria group bacterium]|nr:DEAD/DEAH box helicase [Patescibacteria group bacterium]